MKKASYIMMIVICCLYGLSAIINLILWITVVALASQNNDAAPAFALGIVSIVLTLIPLAWIGPMTARAKKHINNKKPAVALGVCTIIFIALFAFLSLISPNPATISFSIIIFILGLVSGIFLLINEEPHASSTTHDIDKSPNSN